MEQTTFILRYVSLPQDGTSYEIHETFLKFVDCNKKTGSDIAELILHTLSSHNISIKFCRGQGYDNGANMAGKYKGAQACIQKYNNLAVFSPCACHSLNLCGTHAAECCEEVQTFFGTIQKFYNIFSSSPARWDILQKNIGCSLYSLSYTRWSDRLESLTVPSPGNEVLCDSTGSHSITVTPGQVFKTVDEIERFIMHLQIDHHHPLIKFTSQNQLNLTTRMYSNTLVNIL